MKTSKQSEGFIPVVNLGPIRKERPATSRTKKDLGTVPAWSSRRLRIQDAARVAASPKPSWASRLVFPSPVGRLLLGSELSGLSTALGRVAGIALIALGIACWPGRTALGGMLTYIALTTAFSVTWASAANGSGPSCGRQSWRMQS